MPSGRIVGRIATAVSVVWLAACANEPQVSALSLSAIPGGPAIAAKRDVQVTEADVEARLAAKQTLAGRVLAAIALERVTGRKPDPARLAGLTK